MIYIIVKNDWKILSTTCTLKTNNTLKCSLLRGCVDFILVLKMSTSRNSEVGRMRVLKRDDFTEFPGLYWKTCFTNRLLIWLTRIVRVHLDIYIAPTTTVWHSPLNHWWRHCLLSDHHGSTSTEKITKKN